MTAPLAISSFSARDHHTEPSFGSRKAWSTPAPTFRILLLHHPSVDQRDNACPDSHECRNRSGLFEATALEDRTFGPAACHSAGKFGSDSLLMKFADGVALIWREN